MNYIKKMFKQYPFIYYINERYYAFGSGVCAQSDDRSVSLKPRYNLYVNALKENISEKDAWNIFYNLMIEAKYIRNCIGFQTNELLNFRNLNFNEEEINEITRQVKCYIEYFQKNNIKAWM